MDVEKKGFVNEHASDIYLELLKHEVTSGLMTGKPDKEAVKKTYRQICEAVELLYDEKVAYWQEDNDLHEGSGAGTSDA